MGQMRCPMIHKKEKVTKMALDAITLKVRKRSDRRVHEAKGFKRTELKGA